MTILMVISLFIVDVNHALFVQLLKLVIECLKIANWLSI